MIYWYSSLLFLLLYSQYILVVLSYADEQEWSLYLFLYIPTQEMFSYSLEFYLEIIPYPFYKYLPSIAGYPYNVVLGSIYCNTVCANFLSLTPLLYQRTEDARNCSHPLIPTFTGGEFPLNLKVANTSSPLCRLKKGYQIKFKPNLFRKVRKSGCSEFNRDTVSPPPYPPCSQRKLTIVFPFIIYLLSAEPVFLCFAAKLLSSLLSRLFSLFQNHFSL